MEEINNLIKSGNKKKDFKVKGDSLLIHEEVERFPKYVHPEIREEIEKFENDFVGLSENFKLIDKIGEGTFSSVYKAIDLKYDNYLNDWDINYKTNDDNNNNNNNNNILELNLSSKKKNNHHLVAIKRIYPTSSPARIKNELKLLHKISGRDTIASLITAFRYYDQFVVVLPYFHHQDFREFYKTMTIFDISKYFKCLFDALSYVHEAGILHRDVKPTNFLYDIKRHKGVLLDFGLAEEERHEAAYCLCRNNNTHHISHLRDLTPAGGYLKNDSRSGRRANRAGTRGFRAPEVLLKCMNQTSKIDVWSAGVILLTFLTQRFPFFNSNDDTDALIEIASIFGKKKMQSCAIVHGQYFETDIPTIPDSPIPFEEIVETSLLSRNRPENLNSPTRKLDEHPEEEALAFDFLRKCMETDFRKRLSSKRALKHKFLTINDSYEDSNSK